MSKLRVNRYLKDKAMDHIDHALGRPLDPMVETYRNHFACAPDSGEAAKFRASPHWSEGEAASWSGKMAFFYVTEAGRKALRDHLKSIADPHRQFNIEFMGYCIPVVSTTRSKARYSYWREVSDALPDLTFRDFCKRARVASACTLSHGRPRDRAEPPASIRSERETPGMGGQR